MVDVLTPSQRKFNMSRIRGSDTAPELKIRKMLYSRGIRGYRTHYNLVGKPDLVFIKRRLVIFIDGCFWHKCPICFKLPSTRTDFWINKINKNVERDRIVNGQLNQEGWTVLRYWEHEVRKCPDNVVDDIIKNLKK